MANVSGLLRLTNAGGGLQCGLGSQGVESQTAQLMQKMLLGMRSGSQGDPQQMADDAKQLVNLARQDPGAFQRAIDSNDQFKAIAQAFVPRLQDTSTDSFG
jgi:hypothetical protein